MVRFIQPDQEPAEQRWLGEIKNIQRKLGCSLKRQRPSVFHSPGGVYCDSFEFEYRAGMNHLSWLAIDLFERGSEYFVSRYYTVNRPLENILIERSDNSNRAGYVIRGARRGQRGQEPEPCLRERQRYRSGAIEPRNNGRHRRLAASDLIFDTQSQPRDCRRIKNLSERQIDIERRPQSRNYFGGGQRIAALIKEALVQSDPVNSERGAKDLSYDLLDYIAKWFSRTVRSATLILSRRQAATVYFSASRQRHLVKLNKGGREHVRRESLLQERLQRREIRLAVLRGDKVGDQLFFTRPDLARDNNRLLDPTGLAHRHFDFTGLDAITANLQLMIRAAEKLDSSVRQITSPIARRVEQRA